MIMRHLVIFAAAFLMSLALNAQEKTLRVDYIFSGTDKSSEISLRQMYSHDGWAGRRVNMSDVPVYKIAAVLKEYEEAKELAEKYELDLLVENVVCNVENPMKHLVELWKKYPEIHFVFDTKMAAFHEQLDLLYEEEYAWLWKEDHIRHYHVNDYGGGYMDWSNLRTLPIGKGKIDFERFFEFIKGINYQGDFTVEATAFDSEGNVDVGMLNEQFRYIRGQIG